MNTVIILANWDGPGCIDTMPILLFANFRIREIPRLPFTLQREFLNQTQLDYCGKYKCKTKFMEMISNNTYRRIFKAVAILKIKLIAQKLSGEKLDQITGRLEMLYQENQKLREALKQNIEDYNRQYNQFKREYHSIEKQLQKPSPVSTTG